jgi:phosphatidylglycerophosphatase A
LVKVYPKNRRDEMEGIRIIAYVIVGIIMMGMLSFAVYLIFSSAKSLIIK